MRIERGRVARAVFPPEQVAQVKAIACELPRDPGVPLSRFSRAELHRLVVERAVSEASASTIGRWLAEDAIKPVAAALVDLPARPRFREKAGPVLDLYERRWEGELLHPGEFVICADEKTQIQARSATPRAARRRRAGRSASSTSTSAAARCATWPPGTSTAASLIGRCETQTGIEPFGRLVEQVMTAEPYASRGGCSGSSTTAPRTAGTRRRPPPDADGPT